MNLPFASELVADLLIVLGAGLVSGLVCKRVGVSLLVGYLVVGALIGEGGLRLVSQDNHELEYLARAGALLLLFSVGIEFSAEELARLSRFFFVGGAVQMVLAAAPLIGVCLLLGMTWQAALLVGGAGALSSTVLVFKALSEWGQSATPHGRRAIGVLLFQDAALVPMMLFLPLLTGVGQQPTSADVVWLIGKSAAFVTVVMALRRMVASWIAPLLANLRSVELVVLFALCALGGVCWASFAIGLPPALGALAAGIMLSGNRLSRQIDTLVLPYRETFAAVFFVTLGTLLQPMAFAEQPMLLAGGLVGMLLLKSLAATIALRLTGLDWRPAAGMGIGLAQLGEFSFLLVAEGVSKNVIDESVYSSVLFIALGTLIVTPLLIRLGGRWTGGRHAERRDDRPRLRDAVRVEQAIVVGMGPIGRRVASWLETQGIDVRLVDYSPINLYPFNQQGFQTVAGDARDPEALRRADAPNSRLGVVCVPDDDAASEIVRSLRELNPSMSIIGRCHFLSNTSAVRAAGASAVVCEERETSEALLTICQQLVK